jgi:hypothetical protein
MTAHNRRKDVLDERHDQLRGQIARGGPDQGSTSFLSRKGMVIIGVALGIALLWWLLS